MTLSLDDVRNKRFRMARKSGYEVVEVDEFVDEVEASFAQVLEENQNLKKQVDSLQQSAPAAPADQPSSTAGPAQAAQERIVVTTGKEASSAVVRLVEMSTEQAERLVAEASEEAQRIREEARRNAERVETDAQATAQRVQADAVGRAERVDADVAARRAKLLGELEQQRVQLSATVNDLRKFEAAYRTNLTNHLRSQIDTLQSGRAEPADVPPGLRASGSDGQGADQRAAAESSSTAERDAGAGQASDTPRLNALLRESR